MCYEEYEAAVAAFIRRNGVTRCPTACALPTQAAPAASDQAALQRYQLTEEEYRSWERAFEQHGLAGLRSTRLQQYRGPRPPRGPRSRR